MPAVQAVQRRSRGVMNSMATRQTALAIGHTERKPRENTEKRRRTFAVIIPTPGAYTTCTGTFGSGVLIGMELIRAETQRIRRVLQMAPVAFTAEAAGMIAPKTVDRRTATDLK